MVYRHTLIVYNLYFVVPSQFNNGNQSRLYGQWSRRYSLWWILNWCIPLLTLTLISGCKPVFLIIPIPSVLFPKAGFSFTYIHTHFFFLIIIIVLFKLEWWMGSLRLILHLEGTSPFSPPIPQMNIPWLSHLIIWYLHSWYDNRLLGSAFWG